MYTEILNNLQKLGYHVYIHKDMLWVSAKDVKQIKTICRHAGIVIRVRDDDFVFV